MDIIAAQGFNLVISIQVLWVMFCLPWVAALWLDITIQDTVVFIKIQHLGGYSPSKCIKPWPS